MFNQIIKILYNYSVIVLIVIIVAAVILIPINRYVYSWIGLFQSKLGLCEYKSISVKFDEKGNRREKLNLKYDLQQIAAAMKTNSNFEVDDKYNGNGLWLSRTFDSVVYNIAFKRFQDDYQVDFNNTNFKGYSTGSVSGGEKCTTPTYFIERNINQMIDDLPLSPIQNAELKSLVTAGSTINGRLF